MFVQHVYMCVLQWAHARSTHQEHTFLCCTGFRRSRPVTAEERARQLMSEDDGAIFCDAIAALARRRSELPSRAD